MRTIFSVLIRKVEFIRVYYILQYRSGYLHVAKHCLHGKIVNPDSSYIKDCIGFVSK